MCSVRPSGGARAALRLRAPDALEPLIRRGLAVEHAAQPCSHGRLDALARERLGEERHGGERFGGLLHRGLHLPGGDAGADHLAGAAVAPPGGGGGGEGARAPRRPALARLAGGRGTRQAGHGAGAHALRHVGSRRAAERRHETLRGDQHRAALAHARADLADGGGQAAARHGHHDQVDARELDLGDGSAADALVEPHARQVLGVLALGLEALRLGRCPAAQLHLESGARQDDADGGAHAAGAHHGGGAERRQSAGPLPLEADAGPDPLGHLAGEEGRRPLHAREGKRRAAAHVDLDGPDQQTRTGALRAGDRDRHDGGAALEREAPNAALRPAERSRSDAGALGEDHDGIAAVEQLEGGLHRLLVRFAAADREGAHAVEEPAEDRVPEELLLRYEVDRAREAVADRERVEEAAVIRGEHDAPVRDVLAAKPAQPEVAEDETLQEPADGPVQKRVDTAPPGALVVELERTRAQQGFVSLLLHRLLLPARVRAVTLAATWSCDGRRAERWPERWRPPCGQRRCRSTSGFSAPDTTTWRYSASSSRAGRGGRPRALQCTLRTARCSAPRTRWSGRWCRCRPWWPARRRDWPSTRGSGRSPG